ncbi:MAG: F0F1 ATP synthase subunit A [Hyphomicrobium sp.]|nr:F0F1 ATP synthase subunit A [Hyphomicrobium sp.]
MPDPIHQFEVKRLIPLELNGIDVSFTNASLFMVAAVAIIFLFLMYASGGRALVPTRLQSVAETLYEFVAGMIRDSMGEQGMKFFPLIFSLFMFILTLNMLGMVPGFFTVTSQLWITAALALLVFLTVIVVGFAKNGVGFLKLFVPDGVPIYVLPLVSIIEVISFFSRPLSHSLRLFANMLAGHITLKVFAGFIVMLLGTAGTASLVAPLPFLAVLGITALEFLVAFLQAYVFTMLTCMYLNDALHPGH